MQCRWLPAVLTLAVPLLAGDPCAPSSALPLALLKAGECHAARQQWREAEELFRGYRQAAPGDARGLRWHAQALTELGQRFDAALEVEEFLKSRPESVPALKLYGGLLETVMRDFREAEAVLARCSQLAPRDVEVWQALGRLYLSKHQPVDAVRCFRRAAELAPADPLVLSGLGAAYGQNHEPQKADIQFKRALQASEQSAKPAPGPYLVYAEYLLEQDRPQDTPVVLARALQLDPHSAMAYYWRASALAKLEDWPRAKADALAAVREAPKLRPAHLLLVRIYRAAGDSESAQREAETVTQLTQAEEVEHQRARQVRDELTRAEALLHQESFAGAATAYESIIRLLPTFYEAYFALGMCYGHLGRPLEAEQAFRKYLSMQPVSADGHAALGVLLLGQNRTDEARRELEEAVRLDPQPPEPRSALADVYLAQKAYGKATELAQGLASPATCPEALRIVTQVLASEPAHPQARQLRATLPCGK